MEYFEIIVAIATLVLYPAVGLIFKFINSQNKRFNDMDNRLKQVLDEPKTRQLIEDKLAPLKGYQRMIKERLDKLEQKIDSILEKVSKDNDFRG